MIKKFTTLECFMLRNNTKIILNFLILALLTLTISCSSDDDSLSEEDEIQIDAKKEDLAGIWSIYSVEGNGVDASVPATTEECGRDFFIYNESGFYEEFVFQESNTCLPTKSKFRWTLNQGIIKVSTLDNSESETIKIKSINNNTFIFIIYLDLDGDSVKDKYTFTALKYVPSNEMDIYTSSFQRKNNEPFDDHIEFGWNKYQGYNTFVKYEIYRSGTNCNINTAELIKTITNVDENYFIDETPLDGNESCYFLKFYTNKGLLGESESRYINTEFIYPKNVVFTNYEVVNNSINLSWEKYSGYYFSHYEIRVQDQNENSSPNIAFVKNITDINTTSFIDENPPYINNPIYTIYAHNIFGNISNLYDEKSMIATDFMRPEILEFNDIKFLIFDAKSQSFFIYGETNDYNSYRLVKYNYIDNKIIAETFKMPTSSTDVEMKLITSEEGKELVFDQRGELFIYDAESLNFKYSLKTEYISTNSFSYLGNNIWALSDYDNIYTYKRDKEKFVRIDEKLHFTEHQGSMNYEITKINKNSILVSHNNEGRAIHYSINDEGQITNNGIIQMPLKFNYNSDVEVNENSNLILNKMRNTIYSSVDFSQVLNYSIPKTTLSFNKLGTQVYGTNNVESFSEPGKDYKKELIIYNIQDKTTTTLITKGYPNFVMEDDLGNVVSLSTSFPASSYYGYIINDSPGIFVEIVK